MAKIERKYLAHYINTAPQGDMNYERLGKDLEEFSPELSAQVETKKNILGKTSVLISGYEKKAAVETFYADDGCALYDRLQEIIDKNSLFEELKTDVVEVKLWNGEGNEYPAIKEEAYIEINSYGGDVTGYQIPFTLHFTGEKVLGYFNITTRTFIED